MSFAAQLPGAACAELEGRRQRRAARGRSESPGSTLDHSPLIGHAISKTMLTVSLKLFLLMQYARDALFQGPEHDGKAAEWLEGVFCASRPAKQHKRAYESCTGGCESH